MEKVQDCPKCGLVNPPTAQRCDCGWDFVLRRQEQSYLEPKNRLPAMTGVGVLVIIAAIMLARVLGWIMRMATK